MSNLVPVESSITPQLSRRFAIEAAVEHRNTLVEFVKAAMVPGTDYGNIPGTDKPTLLKPGAEKLTSLFNLCPQFEIIEKTEDWTGQTRNGEPFFYYWYRCKMVNREGATIAEGEGSCNSWEKKYRYRNADRSCPNCGNTTILKSKKPGEGFFCWAKKGGCGATFSERDPAIVNQEVGKVPNPDIFDQINTIQKMAQKRAMIQATLIACNASEFFSQDMEDLKVIDLQIVSTAPALPAVVDYKGSQTWKTFVGKIKKAPTFEQIEEFEALAHKRRVELGWPQESWAEIDALVADARARVNETAAVGQAAVAEMITAEVVSTEA